MTFPIRPQLPGKSRIGWFGKTWAVIVVWLLTAFMFWICIEGLGQSFDLSNVALVLIFPLAILLIGLRIVRGSLDAAREAASQVWERDHTEPIPRNLLPKRVRRQIVDDEEVLLRYREHPISLWKWWVFFGLLQAGLIYVPQWLDPGLWLLVAWTSGMLAVAMRILLWREAEMFVTTSRLLKVKGVMSTHLPMMPVGKVTDLDPLETKISLNLARLRIINLPYGVILVESAGQVQGLNRLEYVPHLNEVLRTLTWLVTHRTR